MRARSFLPRPEYPRPDFQRGFVHGVDWINLNGPWEFRFDPDDMGNGARWFDLSPEAWTEQIVVPFCWESLAAWGEADAAGNDNFYSLRAYRDPLEVHSGNYRSARRHEIGWYRRSVAVPNTPHWRGRRIILTVGAADFYTDAWCNGAHLGSHEGGYTPFEFDLTDVLQDTGDGVLTGAIVFRVADPMDNREQPVGKQWGWYSSVSGIWQTIYLEPRPAEYIRRFEVTSDLAAKEVKLTIFTHGGNTVRVDATSPEGLQMSATSEVTSGEATVLLHPSPMRLWENEPNLYKVRIYLLGDTEDSVHSYFGIRSLSACITEEGAPASLS